MAEQQIDEIPGLGGLGSRPLQAELGKPQSRFVQWMQG